MLDEISKALPDFVWLTTLDETTGDLRFPGQSNSLAAVADFISGLQRSGWFPQVDLVSSQEDQSIVNFTLTGTFKDPEVAAKEKAAAEARPPRRREPAAPGERARETEMADNTHQAPPRRSARRLGGHRRPDLRRLLVLLVLDALEQQKKHEARLAELQTEIRALEATANKLPEFQREVQALEARLETLKRILPAEKETPDLMRRVQYLAASRASRSASSSRPPRSRRSSTRKSRSTSTSRAPTTTWASSSTESAVCPAW